MKYKFISIILSSLVIVSNSVSSVSFNYKYQIKANSYSPLDVSTAYYYKEKMIDKYEDFFFDLEEKSQIEYAINHTDFFKLYDNVSVKNINGTICVTIGKGKGSLIKGQFKKNECDSGVINEKYFILDIFEWRRMLNIPFNFLINEFFFSSILNLKWYNFIGEIEDGNDSYKI